MRQDRDLLWIGILGAAVLGLAAYGFLRESRPVPPPVSAAGPASPEPGAVATPVGVGQISIQADAAVPADGAVRRATVQDPELRNLAWSIEGGTLEPGTGGDTALWKGGEGFVVLTCKGEDAQGRPRQGSVQIQVRGLPVIERFEASAPCITRGGSVRLAWFAKDIAALTLDPGTRDVTTLTGPPLELKPTETTEYRLTARHASGLEVSRTVKVKVVDPPEILSVVSAPPAADGTITVTIAFKGGRAELRGGGAVLASGEASPMTVTLPRPPAGAAYSLTVTNEAKTAATSALTYGPSAPPKAP